MDTNLSTSFSRFTNDIADFYHGMREYWSTRTLMQGYGEAAKDITELVEDATCSSNPMVQACAGSGLAVAKMLGAIPIGIDHWVIETARATVHHGVGAGFKTLLGTPIEGFVDGGKFVLNQAKKWSRGEIASSTMGVADEVATTLGTAGLMFLGIKGIHTGGMGLIQGLKNLELPAPSPVLATGQVMTAASVSAGAINGGPLAKGLVFMASKNDSSENEPPTTETGQGKVKNSSYPPPSSKRLNELLDLAEKKNPGAIELLMRMDLEAIINNPKSPKQRARILGILCNQGEIQTLQTLGELAKIGDEPAFLELLNLLKDYYRPRLPKELNLDIRKQAFHKLTELPNPEVTALELIKILHRLPPEELGVPVLNWLIKESVQTPRIANYLKAQKLNGHFPDYWNPYLTRTYAHADFSPVYELAKKKLLYREMLASPFKWIKTHDPAIAEGTALYQILKELGLEG